MKLKILFTSDLHGYFFPTDYIHTGCRPMGVNALSGMFRAARDENTLTIDGGDTLQGSPFAYSFSEPSALSIGQILHG